MNIQRQFSIWFLITLTAGLLAVATNLAAGPLKVHSAEPNTGAWGEKHLVKITGEGFNHVTSVRFLVTKTTNNGNLEVEFNCSGGGCNDSTIYADVEIPDGATIADYDIEVQLQGGRKGKGTTLFRVESSGGIGNECKFDFEATFDDAETDGVVSDEEGSYVAWGGAGLRLDTNGSIKLERRNDTRFIYIDFRAAGVCTNVDDGNPDNDAFGAAGFCHEFKGVDLRLEHQLEEPNICSIQPGSHREMIIKVNFEADQGNTLLNGGQIPKRGGATTLTLNYGCVAPRLDPADQASPGLVTRVNDSTWTFEGEWACLHTNLGDMYEDGDENTWYLYMPFKITFVDVDAL